MIGRNLETYLLHSTCQIVLVQQCNVRRLIALELHGTKQIGESEVVTWFHSPRATPGLPLIARAPLLLKPPAFPLFSSLHLSSAHLSHYTFYIMVKAGRSFWIYYCLIS